MFEKLKEFYWFNIRTRCPICHEKLMETGYGFGFVGGKLNYKCKCGWG